MIDITKLSDKDVGRWVVYKDDTASREVGKIRQQAQDKKLAKQTAYIQKLVIEQELQDRGYYNIF